MPTPAMPELPLADIHPPPPAGWWPPAPGWWLLVLLLVAVLFALLRWGARHYRQRRVRRRVLALFDATMARPLEPAARVAELSALLRRAARRIEPKAPMLADGEWLRWLDAGDPARPFSNGPGRLLLSAPYRPAPVDPEALAALVPLARARIADWWGRADV